MAAKKPTEKSTEKVAIIQQVNSQRMVLEGDLNQHTVAALRIQYSTLIKSAESQVSIDLAKVERSTSVGLSLLLCYIRKAKKLNKTVVFVNIPDSLFEMARVSGLDDVLPLGRDS